MYVEILCQRVEWVLLVHEGAQWQTLVNTVPYEEGNGARGSLLG
jgi:hypothetical protein